MDETPEEGLQDVAAELNELATGLVRHLLSDRQGMSLTTVAALGRLEQEGPIRLTALAAAEGIAQPSMTALVQRLERQGLASRSTDPADGRVCLVAITDAGRELLAERHRAQRARVAGLLAALPEQDVQALSEAMHTALPIVRRMLRGESAS
ncbi:MarR family winged helix-turn-helix transcriptional regulator [Kitasatospora aureofaciens]|uniref:MarR family winged helix-turn-helix transcriptional regulator n=1 Tax=Kitasatospora aureofaciens TaxID=1894 RepID=UPI001C46A805|nr:MarR family winged helix-turn-helix transcriptional regulator [Kitasatospora aureofaciens]MBV6701690.1 MarR family winged helix-turn-helix transcriptional regulator [Kitasatospora aureofaciens]